MLRCVFGWVRVGLRANRGGVGSVGVAVGVAVGPCVGQSGHKSSARPPVVQAVAQSSGRFFKYAKQGVGGLETVRGLHAYSSQSDNFFRI